MLRILTFLENLDPGGVERVAIRFAGQWQSSGHKVTLALGQSRGALLSELPATIDIVTPDKPLRWYIELLPHTLTALRTARPDIIYCAGNYYSFIAAALKLSLGKKCPPIVCKISNALVRGDYNMFQQSAYTAWLRLHSRYIDHFVAISPALKKEFCAVARMPEIKVSVITDPYVHAVVPESVDQQRQLNAFASSQAPLVVAAGRLMPQKDFALLIHAFAMLLAHRDARLAILGDGPERGKLEALVEKLQLRGKVLLPGHVTNLHSWMTQADVFALSSVFEGLPAVVVESLAAGTPVVATDCCSSLVDIITKPELGRIVPYGDAAALASALLAQLAMKPEPEQLKASVASFYSNDSAEKHVGLFTTLLDNRANQPQTPAAVYSNGS